MQISFIIPHKGRFEMLSQTLESINRQNFNLQNVEVIVVSQTPELTQQELVKNPLFQLSIYTRPVNETISALRNYGVSEATGKYVAFLDADIWLSENWIEQMINELALNPNRIISSAMQICNDDAPALEKIRTNLSNADVNCEVAFLPGRNLFLTKADFNKIGGFPEHLVTCEDYYFTDQAAKLGKLFYTSKATYIHLGEDKVYKDMFHKEIWRGQSNLQSIAGRSIPLREWPSFIAPPAVLLVFTASLILLLLGFFSFALLSFLVAVLPIFIYSLRLFLIADKKLSLIHILKFYFCYFPARAIGTVLGLFKSIGIKTY
ncbi:glycosyltransferase [Paraglaciecola sp. 2405UD69-4]|uniref:glycosyltransferase n=1 Tax=Paraglaciecola sp. 2405UD69-4 TaxID=3391836 RepID=UPI0039C8C0A5